MGTSAGKRKITRETVTEVEDETEGQEEAEEGASEHPEAPLFSPLLRQAKRIESVGLRRLDPDSGYLCPMPSDVTESQIKARWGGGLYRLEGKNAAGQIVKDGVRSCKIAGEPIFASELEEKEWRTSHGLREKPAEARESVKDLLMLFEERDERRREEQTKREEQWRADQAAREERSRAELDARLTAERTAREERERQLQKDADDREERRRAQAREDDERRSRQHREDMERLQALNATTLQQSQAFYQQMAASLKHEQKQDDPVKTLMAGVQLAASLKDAGGGGGGEESPLMAMAKRLPEIITEARLTGGAILTEIAASRRAGGGAVKNAAARPAPAVEAAKPDQVVITGALAKKARAVLTGLARQGKDPEAEIDKLLTFAAASIGDEAAAAPAVAANRPPASRPAPSPRPRPAARRPQPVRRPPPRVVKRR